MATSRLDNSGVFQPFSIEADSARFTLPPSAVRVRPNGVEFHSPKAFPVWHEMTVALQAPGAERKLRCNGVVVACDGNRHSGYAVSLLFLNLSRQSSEQLAALANAYSI
jgi:hypothetical protein